MPRITKTFADTSRFSSGHKSEAYSNDGGKTWLWVSNDSVIMLDVCRTHEIPCDVAAQTKARAEYVHKNLEEYRMKNYVPTNEEMCEMAAAFGPGTTVVNVITGKRTRL